MLCTINTYNICLSKKGTLHTVLKSNLEKADSFGIVTSVRLFFFFWSLSCSTISDASFSLSLSLCVCTQPPLQAPLGSAVCLNSPQAWFSCLPPSLPAPALAPISALLESLSPLRRGGCFLKSLETHSGAHAGPLDSLLSVACPVATSPRMPLRGR